MEGKNKMPDKSGFLSNEEINDLAKKEWVGILERLWRAINKPLDPMQLEVYADELGEIPLGLLERAVGRCIRENQYTNIPSVGTIWQAVRRELGNPYDLRLAIGEWVEAQADKVIKNRELASP
jgi:hypothetical protein